MRGSYQLLGGSWCPVGGCERSSSEWLVHVNRRHNGSWVQRYENGVPVTGLVSIADDGTRGTTVQFLAGEALRTAGRVSPRHLVQLTAMWRQLAVDLNDDASGTA